MKIIKLDYSISEIDYILREMAKITISTTSWIFGDDMGSPENISVYLEYKKKTKPITYLLYDRDILFGYLTLSINSRILYIEDVHILLGYRNNLFIMKLILQAIAKEYILNIDTIDKVVYYINKKNNLSQDNFEKYAKEKEESKNNYKYTLDLNHPFIRKILKSYKNDIITKKNEFIENAIVNDIKYELLIRNDRHIDDEKTIYKIPEISRYIDISDNFFDYVTNTENVYLLKILKGETLIGNIHFEIYDDIMYIAIMVIPKYQRKGIAKNAVEYVMNNYKCNKYYASIEEGNNSSIKLFESLGFKYESKEDDILNYVYIEEK